MDKDFAVTQSVEDVEKILLEIHDLQSEISAAKDKRDRAIDFFKGRIAVAEKNFIDETKFAESEIARLSYSLEVYLKNNPPAKKKSVSFAGGIIGWRKQEPVFSFDDGEPLSSTNKKLLAFVKAHAADFLKVSESVDWKNLKSNLLVDNGCVFLKDTGELVYELHAEILPDKFTVKVYD